MHPAARPRSAQTLSTNQWERDGSHIQPNAVTMSLETTTASGMSSRVPSNGYANPVPPMPSIARISAVSHPGVRGT